MLDGFIAKSLARTGGPLCYILGQTKEHLGKISLREPYAHLARPFRGPQGVQDLGKWAFTQFLSDNGFFSLHASYRQKIKWERLVMGVSPIHPEKNFRENFISGGTESNFLAVRAAKKWAREHKPNVGKPNIVAPLTIHPSFDKGLRCLDLEIITTDQNENRQGIVANFANATNDDTIMIGASAPSTPYANIDPIPQIAAVAREASLWMRVYAYVGGYISPFLEKLGTTPTPVTSLSPESCQYPPICTRSGTPKPESTTFWRHADPQNYHYEQVCHERLRPFLRTTSTLTQ